MKRIILVGGLMTSLLGGVALADHPPGRVYTPEAYGQHAAYAPQAARAGWTRLGELGAGRWRDASVLHVGREAGRFSRLMLVARDAVHVHALRVTFGNGQSQELVLHERLDRVGRSVSVDLPGDARSIISVELLARGRPRQWGGGGGRVELWGEAAVRGRPWIGGGGGGYQGGWSSLGTTTLNGRHDRDTIHVGRELGRFRQLMVVFHDGDARLDAVLVTFASGQSARLPVQRRGGSLMVDLPGDARAIRAVTLVGGSAGWGRGGRVEVLAS
jgi:hypothetical protein